MRRAAVILICVAVLTLVHGPHSWLWMVLISLWWGDRHAYCQNRFKRPAIASGRPLGAVGRILALPEPLNRSGASSV
jgi:hypothetical protein